MPCTALTRFQVLPIANVRAIRARSMPVPLLTPAPPPVFVECDVRSANNTHGEDGGRPAQVVDRCCRRDHRRRRRRSARVGPGADVRSIRAGRVRDDDAPGAGVGCADARDGARDAPPRARDAASPHASSVASTTITVDPPSGVAVIRVTDSRGPRARRLANAYAQTLVAARRHADRRGAPAYEGAASPTAGRHHSQPQDGPGRRSRFRCGRSTAPLVRLVAGHRHAHLDRDGRRPGDRPGGRCNHGGSARRCATASSPRSQARLIAIVLLVLTARPGRGRARSARELGRALRMPVLGTLGGSVSDAWEGIGQVRARIAAAEPRRSPRPSPSRAPVTRTPRRTPSSGLRSPSPDRAAG